MPIRLAQLTKKCATAATHILSVPAQSILNCATADVANNDIGKDTTAVAKWPIYILAKNNLQSFIVLAKRSAVVRLRGSGADFNCVASCIGQCNSRRQK